MSELSILWKNQFMFLLVLLLVIAIAVAWHYQGKYLAERKKVRYYRLLTSFNKNAQLTTNAITTGTKTHNDHLGGVNASHVAKAISKPTSIVIKLPIRVLPFITAYYRRVKLWCRRKKNDTHAIKDLTKH